VVTNERKKEKKNLICAVCSARAFGYNFDQISCESCKGKINFQKKLFFYFFFYSFFQAKCFERYSKYVYFYILFLLINSFFRMNCVVDSRNTVILQWKIEDIVRIVELINVLMLVCIKKIRLQFFFLVTFEKCDKERVKGHTNLL
jgi:hypothetical protein